MSNLLGIGSSALLAYRSALDVVGHNVANVDTVGYSRQRADLQARAHYGASAGSGSGVDVSTVQRLSDRFMFDRLVSEDSSYARIQTYQTLTAQLDTWLSTAETGLAQPLQTFFDGLNGLAANPGSSSARQVVLQGAASLSATFGSLQSQMDQLDAEIDGRVGDAAAQINGISKQIATLNERIAEARAASPNQQPNDLIDQRDTALRSLADYVGVSASTAEDGSMNVFIGSGQALVLGNRAGTLSVQSDAYGRPREIMLSAGGGGVAQSVSQQISGGAIGGLLDFRREVLDPAANELGRIAVGLADAINAQHAEGMDQYGQLGGDFFVQPRGSVTASRSNTGGATVGIAIADPAQLSGGDYQLSYDGAAWRMTDVATGAVTALAGDGSAANPLRGGGLELTLAGSAAAGDRFLVQPTRHAASQLQTAIKDPARIAASTPVRTSVSATNTGVSQISAPEVLDAADPGLLSTVSIEFTSAGTYRINGGAEQSYRDGGNIDYNGWRVQISGAPVAGNTYTIGRNDGTSGDNGNARALNGISGLKLLDGGRNTLSSANTALVGKVGSQAQQSEVQMNAQHTLRTQTQAQRDATSGVNLDEEAADLMRFQQAYQAAAQIITTANTLFESLLGAVRR